MYEMKARIRYSEVGTDGKLMLSALVNYFQDCSTFQSEDLGVGRAAPEGAARCMADELLADSGQSLSGVV